MSDQIVSRGMMFDRGVAAFNRGTARDSHSMNSSAPALHEWLSGFDRAAQAWREAQRREVSPP